MTYPIRGSRCLALLAHGRAVAIGLGVLLVLLSAGNAHAQTCTAPTTTGEQGWLDVKWTSTDGGCRGTGNVTAACGGVACPVPATGDSVVIPSGSTIRCGINPSSVPAAPTLYGLTVNAGGVLRMGSTNTAGGLVIKGELKNDGTIENGAVVAGRVNSIAVGGPWTNNGTFTPGTTTPRIDVTLNGNSATTVGGTSATAFNNLTISGSGTKTLGANMAATGALTLTSGGLDVTTFTLTANGAVTCGSTITSAATGTVVYASAAAQTICPATYGNLQVSGAGTKTMGGNVTTAGTLTLTAGTLAVGTNTLTANSTVTCGSTITSGATGTVAYASAAAQTICAGTYGNLQVSGGGTKTMTSGAVTVSGLLTLGNNTILAAGSNNLTLSGTTSCGTTAATITSSALVRYSGSGAEQVCAGTYANLTTTGNTKTITGGAVTVSGLLTLSNNTILAAGSNNLTLSGTTSCGTTAATITSSATVTYSRSGAEQVCAGTYTNLTTTGNTKTITGGAVTASGLLTLSNNTILAAGSNNLTLSGTTSCGTTAATITSSATVTYSGASQNVCAGTYATLTTSGSGTKTLGGNVTTTGAINVNAGTTLSQGSSNLTSGGLMTVASTGAFSNTGTGTLTLGGNLVNNGTFLVDGSGGGCTGGAHAIIQSSNTTTRTWSGTGAFQLTDVTLSRQSSALAIKAFHSTGATAPMVQVADCTGAPALPTAVRLASFSATAHGSRVLLKWQTAMETNNIGFRLYREAGDASSPVTPHLISGSALMVGLRATLSGGRSYVWWDDLPAGADARTTRYWLADVDLRGEQTFHGPVVPKPSYAPAPDVRNAPHLQQLAGLTGAPGASPGSSMRVGPAGRVFRGLSPRTPSTTVVQWSLASGRALKIGISQPGWYRVTGQDLTDHGLGNVDPGRLQLFADGQQIPLVARSLARGRSTVPQSTVEFYATGLDSQWSSERTYWLAAGTSAGRRIGKVRAEAAEAAPASFAFTVESAPKVIYFPALMNGDGSKYFGPLVSTDAQAPTTLALDVRHAAPAGQAVLDVAVQGVMDGLHIVAVLINGHAVGQVEFDGQQLGTAHLLLDQPTSLIEGSNQIALWAEGGAMDLSLVQSVGLTYWRRYVADGDTLAMTAPGGSRLVVGGFSSPRIRVMDVTDPENPYELLAAVQNDGSGYAVATDVAGAGVRDLLAFADETVASPASLKTNSPSSWHSADKAANLIVLTHAAVADALRLLVRLREGQGYVVAVVDVEDVYDEFSFGNKTPQALRDFLALASSTWRKRPGFVLLAGSASGDPRNFLGYGDSDLVPTKFVEATYNQAASDDWFVDFNDDGLPSLAIGRLPVRDSIQAAAVVQKLVGYSRTGGADWRKTAVLVSGPATDYFDFPAATDAVAAQIPTSMFLTQIFRGDFADDTLAHAAVLGAFNQGALLVNYMGHASETAWQGNLLSMDDVPLLTNGSRLPFVSSMTCWTGWFADPYGETLGEALLKAPQGGAIAVWASSGLTEPDGQLVLDREFMRLLFAARKPTIGEATARAKAAVSDIDVRRTWILLGDPTMKLE